MVKRAQPVALRAALGRAAGDKRIEILRLVARGGSISQAARDAGVSYKAAWQALEMLTNLAGVPLVERAVGGSGGGGARLTPAGRQVLDAALAVDQSLTETLARLGSHKSEVLAAGRLAVRTSMRNQIPCVIRALVVSGPLVRVQLQLPTGQALHARITRESAQLLGLHVGLPLIAQFKATAVQIERNAHRLAEPPVGGFVGRVRRIARGDEGDEITVELPDTQVRIVGFAAAGSQLRRGEAAAVSFSESSIVLALPA